MVSCPQSGMCTWLTVGSAVAGASATRDCSPQSSWVLAWSRGHACVHSEGPAPSAPVMVVGSSRGNSSSTCPVSSGAVRIWEELTRPGSTFRTPFHLLWRPHHVPQTSDNVIAAAAVTLLHIDSNSSPVSGDTDPLAFIALCMPVPGRRTIENRGDTAHYLCTAPGHRRSVGGLQEDRAADALDPTRGVQQGGIREAPA